MLIVSWKSVLIVARLIIWPKMRRRRNSSNEWVTEYPLCFYNLITYIECKNFMAQPTVTGVGELDGGLNGPISDRLRAAMGQCVMVVLAGQNNHRAEQTITHWELLLIINISDIRNRNSCPSPACRRAQDSAGRALVVQRRAGRLAQPEGWTATLT